MPAIEFDPPDLSAYAAGNTGIPYVTSFAAGTPGPHVVLNALMHGNEICGAVVLDEMLRAGLRPTRGRLTFVFANIAAYQSFNHAAPNASRYIDEDMNRIWGIEVLDGPVASQELLRARALRPVFDAADFLLDIHSMTHANAPLMLTGMQEKHLAFARRVGIPALLVRDDGHDAGRRLRDYGAFADPAAPQIALLVECGQHWARPTAEVALTTAWRFLAAAGILSAEETGRWLTPAPPQRTVLVTERITIGTDDFRFSENFKGLEVIPAAGTVIAREGRKKIRTPYDNCVLIMPTQRFVRGQTAVRLGRFVD